MHVLPVEYTFSRDSLHVYRAYERKTCTTHRIACFEGKERLEQAANVFMANDVLPRDSFHVLRQHIHMDSGTR